MKILIVDDSVMDRRLTINLLRKNNVTNDILEAVDGEEGLEVLSQHYQEICLILLDWQMPKMDGIEFMKGVVKVPEVASIPIVMITASGSDDSKREARDANPNLAGYVVKPFKPAELLETIQPYLK
ncbi:MAG: response regulator [Candidatus Omnitrophica bacterium]|nr:response regulator [Candidatus Omnitrophota bacterium]MCB9721207.1 response regulator [Candidatus Omnitrophota bacterium]